MFHIIDEHFFMPLASPNKVVYWECICKLFSVMDISFLLVWKEMFW